MPAPDQPAPDPSAPDELRIPNEATYAPLPLLDVMAVAPLASRLLLGATVPGRVIQLAAMGLYTRSALRDWAARREMVRIDFLAEFGADVHQLEAQPRTSRAMEVNRLGALLAADWEGERPPRRELAATVNRALTDFMAGITGQRVETSDAVRSVSLAGLVFPFAQGTCDLLSGDVAIFRDAGIFEAHIIAHEFVHRKGYLKELHAQVLAYLALRNSGDPVLVQSARAERLHRQLRVLSGEDGDAYRDLLEGAVPREEVRAAFAPLAPDGSLYRSRVGQALRTLYDTRMRLTGQNGLSDYDRGFTDFLHTFRFAESARQSPSLAAV
ncbi:MAG: DUF3810 family protein [Longimicrobiales bacterium]|nr:DUF3810 family protein [Longimicrobiales bacterium]